MAKREGEKQVSFYCNAEDKERFNALCKTHDLSVGNVMRTFIHRAIELQHLDFDLILGTPLHSPAKTVERGVDDGVVKSILKRLDTVERSIPDYEVEELKKVRKEVLSGDWGSMRYRLGIIENQINELGGSIAWTKG